MSTIQNTYFLICRFNFKRKPKYFIETWGKCQKDGRALLFFVGGNSRMLLSFNVKTDNHSDLTLALFLVWENTHTPSTLGRIYLRLRFAWQIPNYSCRCWLSIPLRGAKIKPNLEGSGRNKTFLHNPYLIPLFQVRSYDIFHRQEEKHFYSCQRAERSRTDSRCFLGMSTVNVFWRLESGRLEFECALDLFLENIMCIRLVENNTTHIWLKSYPIKCTKTFYIVGQNKKIITVSSLINHTCIYCVRKCILWLSYSPQWPLRRIAKKREYISRRIFGPCWTHTAKSICGISLTSATTWTTEKRVPRTNHYKFYMGALGERAGYKQRTFVINPPTHPHTHVE